MMEMDEARYEETKLAGSKAQTNRETDASRRLDISWRYLSTTI